MVGRKYHLLFLLALTFHSGYTQHFFRDLYRPYTDNSHMNSSNNSSRNAEIAWQSEEQDLGYIKMGNTISHNFIFKNVGYTDLVIQRIDTQGPASHSYHRPHVVGVGQRGVLTLQIKPERRGPFKAYFTITSNAKGFVHVLILTGVAY